MSEDGPILNNGSEVDRKRTPWANEEEDEILGTSPDRTGAVLGWVKSALSPLLSASPMMPDELHGLDPSFDDDNKPPIIPMGPLINCSYDGCKRMVGPGSSQFGCPGCGLTYCSTHSGHPSFEVQQTEAGKTRFIRVCLVCWMGRPENQTGLGADRSWANTFSHCRASVRGLRAEQRTQLETRLAQLIRIEEEVESRASSGMDKRVMQQQVAQWVPDEASHTCPICRAEWGLTKRRHHCRLCGGLMCGECTRGASSYNIPACASCYDLLSHAGPMLVTPTDPLLSNYRNLATSRTQILEGLPRFNEYLVELESELAQRDRNRGRIEAIQHDANAIRDTLMLIFEHYEGSARIIGQLADGYHESQRGLIVRNILVTCQRFIKEHRFSLKALPGKLTMFDDQPSESISIPTQDQLSLSQKFLPNFLQSGSRSREQSIQELNLQLPANLGALMQKLEVLHEQKAQLEVFLEDARINRRFGELTTLQGTIEDTEAEITRIKLMCSI